MIIDARQWKGDFTDFYELVGYNRETDFLYPNAEFISINLKTGDFFKTYSDSKELFTIYLSNFGATVYLLQDGRFAQNIEGLAFTIGAIKGTEEDMINALEKAKNDFSDQGISSMDRITTTKKEQDINKYHSFMFEGVFMEKYAQVQPWVDIIKSLPYPRTVTDIELAIKENGQITSEQFKIECESFYKIYLDMLEYVGGKGIAKLTPIFNTVARILDIIGHEPELASEEEQLSLLDILSEDNENNMEETIAASDITITKRAGVGGIDFIDPAVSSPEEITKEMGLITRRMLLVSPEERELLQEQLDVLEEYRQLYYEDTPQSQKPKSTPKPNWSGAYTDWRGYGKGQSSKIWDELDEWKPEGIVNISPRKDKKPEGLPVWHKDYNKEEHKEDPKWYEQKSQKVIKVPEGKQTFKSSSSWTDFHDINFIMNIMQERGWGEFEQDEIPYAEALLDLFDYPELSTRLEYFTEKYNLLDEEAADLIQIVQEYYPELFNKKIASDQILVGGKGDKLDINKIPEKELELGMEVESEHTPNEELQEEIISDHEQETHDYTNEYNYYKDYLIPMEKLMKQDIPLKELANLDTLFKYAEELSKEEEKQKEKNKNTDSFYKEDFSERKEPGKTIDVKAFKNIDELLKFADKK